MSTSVILREGQYVVDQQYPVALVLEMFSLWLILGNTQQWVNFRAKLRHHLFKAFLLFELFILIQICIGFAVNESKNTANYPNIRNHRNNMVYAAL